MTSSPPPPLNRTLQNFLSSLRAPLRYAPSRYGLRKEILKKRGEGGEFRNRGLDAIRFESNASFSRGGKEANRYGKKLLRKGKERERGGVIEDAHLLRSSRSRALAIGGKWTSAFYVTRGRLLIRRSFSSMDFFFFSFLFSKSHVCQGSRIYFLYYFSFSFLFSFSGRDSLSRYESGYNNRSRLYEGINILISFSFLIRGDKKKINRTGRFKIFSFSSF